MGFNIGGFLSAIGPVLGAVTGNPILGVAASAVGAGFTKPQAQNVVGRQVAPVQQLNQGATSISPVPFAGPESRVTSRGFGTSNFGVTPRRVATVASPGLSGGAVMRFMGFAAGAVSEILAEARSNTGQSVTRNKVIDAAKACGIETAANTFGISESDVCKIIVAGRTRRRRGISAADVRRTKRTLRFVKNIKADLKAIRL